MHFYLRFGQLDGGHSGRLGIGCGTQVLAHLVGLSQVVAGSCRQQVVEQRGFIVRGPLQHLAAGAGPIALEEIDQPAGAQSGGVMGLAGAEPTDQGTLAPDQAEYQTQREVNQQDQGKQQQQSHPQAGFQGVVAVSHQHIAWICLDQCDNADPQQQGEQGNSEDSAHDLLAASLLQAALNGVVQGI